MDNDHHTHIDDLVSLCSQIPSTFDFGTITVQFSCIDVSDDIIVIGSNCGTIFVFDRRSGKLQKPLRTSSSEYVSCIRQCGRYIAAGHNSGSLIILRLPSIMENGSKKIEQRVDKDRHRSSSIRCLEWITKGNKLFSADYSGLIILTHVDFDQKVFEHSFVYCGPSPIRSINYRSAELLIHTDDNEILIVCIANAEALTIYEHTANQPSVSCVFWNGCVDKRKLLVLREDLQLLCYDRANYLSDVSSINLLEEIVSMTSSSTVLNGAQFTLPDPGKPEKIIFSRVSQSSECIFICDNGILVSIQMDENCQLQMKLKCHVGGLMNTLIDMSSTGTEYFTLFDKRRLVRISRNEREMVENVSAPSSSTTLSSLVDSTSSFLERVVVPKEETIRAIGTTFDDAATFGINSLDQLSTKIAPKLEAFLGNVQQIVDNSNYGAQEGHLILNENMKENGMDDAFEVSEDIGRLSEISVIRKEKTQRKKKHREIEEEDIEERKERENEEKMNPEQVEQKLVELRNVIASIGHRSVTSSPDRFPITKLNNIEVSSIGNSPKTERLMSHSNTEDIEGMRGSPVPSTSKISEGEVDGESEGKEENTDSERELDEDEALEKLMKGRDTVEESFFPTSPIPLIPTEVIERREKNNEKAVIVNDMVDIWTQITLPFTPSSICSNNQSIILCHRKRSPRWCTVDELGSRKINWQCANFNASQLDTNEDGSLIWRIDKEIAYTTNELTTSAKWTEIARNAYGTLQCSLTNRDAWYMTKRAVNLQMELPEQGILHEMECEWPLKCISASPHAVWAIRKDTGTLVVRVGMNRCRMGYDWVEVSLESCGRLVSICVVDTVGICLDENGFLWMAKGVDEHHPYGNSDEFMRVCTPMDKKSSKSLSSPSEWCLSVSSRGLFISSRRVLYYTRSALSGHRFTRIVPNKLSIYDNFSLLTSGCFSDENKDSIFACRPNSELFSFRTVKKSFLTYTVPLSNGQMSTIISLTSTSNGIFLLDSCGSLFERVIGDDSSITNEKNWKRVETNGECLISIAVSEVSLWAVTTGNSIMARVQNGDETSKWSTVELPTNSENGKIEEIRCSRNGRYVWIISVTGKRCWARSCVTSDSPIGNKWIEACSDPPLIDISIGCNVVWALSIDNTLYRLRGLAAANPTGNYWRAIPVKLRAISVDYNNSLWGINEDSQLVRHLTDVHNFESSPLNLRQTSSFEFI